MSQSLVRHNFKDESETELNNLILQHLRIAFQYKSMCTYFQRDDIGFLGFHEFYKNLTKYYVKKAADLIRYLNVRGGHASFQDVHKPENDTWGSPFDSLEKTLHMERCVYQAYLDLHSLSCKQGDPHLEHFLEDYYIDESAVRIKRIGDYITQLRRVGKGVGEWLFDQVLSKLEKGLEETEL